MPPEHYYGDTVRKLFLSGAIIMLLVYPLFNHTIPAQPMLNIVGIILLSVMAGLTNPRQTWILVADVFLSIAAVSVFEYYAVSFAQAGNQNLFIINQLLAVCFFTALYFAVKTARNALLKNIQNNRTDY